MKKEVSSNKTRAAYHAYSLYLKASYIVGKDAM